MNPEPDNAPEPKLPGSLADALRELGKRRIDVPQALDAAILHAASSHLSRVAGSAEEAAESAVVIKLESPAAADSGKSAIETGDARPTRIFAQAARREPSPYRYRWLAAAAAVVVGLMLLRPWERGSRADLRADLDRNGRVDVMDAFLIARHVGDPTSDPRFDLNGDGVVDQRDVDLAAAQAVRLPTGI